MSQSAARSGRGRSIGLVGCGTSFPPTDSPSVHIYQVWHRMRRKGYEIHTWGEQAVPGARTYPRTDEGFRDLLNNVDLLYVRFPFEYFFGIPSMVRLLTRRSLPVVCEFNAPLYQFTRDCPWLAPWAWKHRFGLYGRNHLMVRACVDHAVCTCRELAGYARGHFGLSDVTVIADGADPDQFHPRHRAAGREAMGVVDDDFVVFWAGITKYRWQGLGQMIAAAERLQDSRVRFVLAGDDAHLPKPLPDNVIALGHVPYFDMPAFMAAADVSLCIYESYDWCPIGFWGSPLKLFEYMASGSPVIGSRMGQMARVIRDGVNGYLTDGEPADIVEKIGLCRRDREHARAMGRAARQTVLSGYTWQNAADRTDDIVRGLLRKSKAPKLSAARAEKPRPAGAVGNGRPRLGFLCSYGGYGGTEEYLNKLVLGAARQGYDVTFFRHRDSPEDWVRALGRHVTVASYNGRPHCAGEARAERTGGGVLRGLRRLHRRYTPKIIRFLLGFFREVQRTRRAFVEHPVDVLHFSDLGADPQIVAARLAGVGRVTGALNCVPNETGVRRTWPLRGLEALCLGCVDGIAAVSRCGRDLWLKRTRISPAKLRVIHNCTELPDLHGADTSRGAVRDELGIPREAVVVGVSATLAPRKGHAYLLDAFPRVLAEVPGAWLALAGDGPSREDLEAQADRLSIAHRVSFLGHRTDMERVVQAYDVVALASIAIESLPFAMLEGMSWAKPAVGTMVGGMPELIENGVSGYVVPSRDADALAGALIELLSDPERRSRMGAAARRRIEDHFNAEQMVRDTLDMMLGR